MALRVDAVRDASVRPHKAVSRGAAAQVSPSVLRPGVVRSYYVALNEREITLATWPAGNFVGGPEIFGGGAHVWLGIALNDGRALHLPAAAIPGLMREVPNFALGLVAGLAFKGQCYPRCCKCSARAR